MKNPQSEFVLSLGLSYPNRADAERGLKAGLITRRQHRQIVESDRAGGCPPWNTPLGGEIFIHGSGSTTDWTWGCVALDDDDIRAALPAHPRRDARRHRALKRLRTTVEGKTTRSPVRRRCHWLFPLRERPILADRAQRRWLRPRLPPSRRPRPVEMETRRRRFRVASVGPSRRRGPGRARRRCRRGPGDTVATRGMVVAAHPDAARAGLEILQERRQRRRRGGGGGVRPHRGRAERLGRRRRGLRADRDGRREPAGGGRLPRGGAARGDPRSLLRGRRGARRADRGRGRSASASPASSREPRRPSSCTAR